MQITTYDLLRFRQFAVYGWSVADILFGRVTATKVKRAEGTKTAVKAKPDLPWNVILHNDWDNSMVRVVIVLKKVIPGMTLKKATAIMYTAHSCGQALVKSCHKELAELYEERLLAKGLTVSIEPAN